MEAQNCVFLVGGAMMENCPHHPLKWSKLASSLGLVKFFPLYPKSLP